MAQANTSRWPTIIMAVALVYFAGKIVFFATQLHPSIPPDETTHMGRVVAFANHAWIPPDTEQTFAHGLIAHQPPLYYLFMGKLLNANVLGIDDVLWLRLFNGLIAVSTVMFAWRWFCLLVDDPAMRSLFVIMLTNTLMFTGLSAAVNYDNLTNFFGAAAMYYLTAVLLRGGVDLGMLLACFGGGALTKEAFLPVAAAAVGVLIVLRRRDMRRVPALAAQAIRQRDAQCVAAWCVAIVLCGWAAGLYGGNLVRFGKPTPSAMQVLPMEDALQNRIAMRDHIMGAFRDGAIDLDTAMRQAATIEHAGDREATVWMLQRIDDWRKAGYPRVSLPTYAWHWTKLMVNYSVGYFGHHSMFKYAWRLYPYHALLCIALVMCVLAFRWREHRGAWIAAAVVVVSYTAVLMLYVNYRGYLRWGEPSLAVQGRYIFPVIAPLYGLLVYHLMRPLPKRVAIGVALVIGAWFVYGDLPDFLIHTLRG